MSQVLWIYNLKEYFEIACPVLVVLVICNNILGNCTQVYERKSQIPLLIFVRFRRYRYELCL